MTIRWAEGFEYGSTTLTEFFDSGSSGGAQETTITSHSDYAWRFNMSAASGQLRAEGTRDPWWANATVSGWLQFQIYITTLPTSGNDFYLWRDVDNNITRFSGRLNDAGNIEIKPEGGAYNASAGALVTGKWYTINVEWRTGVVGTVIATERDTGTEIINHSNGFNGGEWSGGIGTTFIDIGPWATSTGNLVFDNVLLADTADPFIDTGANYTINVLKPNGTGNLDAWTGSNADVDDLPHDSTTTERTFVNPGANQDFTNDVEGSTTMSPGIDALVGVDVHAWVRINSTGNSQNMNLIQSDGINNLYSGNYALGDSGPTTYIREFAWHRALAPDGGAWTVADIDNFEAGVRVGGIFGSHTDSCTAVSAHVLYKVKVPSGTQAIIIA